MFTVSSVTASCLCLISSLFLSAKYLTVYPRGEKHLVVPVLSIRSSVTGWFLRSKNHHFNSYKYYLGKVLWKWFHLCLLLHLMQWIYVVHSSSGFILKCFCRMDLELLQRLRQANQDLLQRLRMKQEEIRKVLPSKQLLSASPHSSTAADRCVPSASSVVCVLSVLEIQGSK